MSAFSDDELQAMERWENDVPFRVDWNQTSSTPDSAPRWDNADERSGRNTDDLSDWPDEPSVVQDGALDDATIRHSLGWLVGPINNPEQFQQAGAKRDEAIAALDRLTTRLQRAEEQVSIAQHVIEMLMRDDGFREALADVSIENARPAAEVLERWLALGELESGETPP